MSATRAIDKEINNYLEHLNTQQKRIVLTLVKTIAKEEDNWWEDVELAAQDSINRGLRQAKSGEVQDHESVMKKYKKWQSK